MEIEGWKKLEPTSVICFNPDCPYSQARIVLPEHTVHLGIDACRRQMQQLRSLRTYDVPRIMEVLNCSLPVLELDFVKNPVDSLKMLHAFSKMNWRCSHANYFRAIRQQLMSALDDTEQESLADFEEFMKSASLYDRLLATVESPSNEARFNERLTQDLHEIQPLMDRLAKQRMFNQRKLQLCVTTAIDELAQIKGCLLSNEDFTEAKPQACIIADEGRFRTFLNEDAQNHFSKVQTLATACGRPAYTYVVKDDERLISLGCFICGKGFSEAGQVNKKQIKKNLAIKVLKHIGEKHFQEVLQWFRQRILKSFVRELSLHEITREVRQGRYTEVEIIDRENAGAYECFDEAKYVVEVISYKNAGLAKGRYLLAKSARKDAADILMGFLVRELFNVREMTIRLVTNDHFGETMKEICDSLNEKLVIFNVKKNDG